MQTKEGVINVIVIAFVADMPAHSPVLVTKGTNGYFGCVTCEVQCVAVRPKETGGHRMTYPTVGEDRVDADFQRADSRFGHRGLSPLTRLLNFDLARDCPIEPMHLLTNVVCRAVGKLLQRQNLEHGVTLDELDDAVAVASSGLPSSCFPLKIYVVTHNERRRGAGSSYCILYPPCWRGEYGSPGTG